MRLQQHVGHGHLAGQVGPLALVGRVLVVADIVPGPAVEGAWPHPRHIVGRQVVAQPVALVGGAPERVGAGLDRHADAVPEAGGEGCVRAAAIGIDGQHVGAPVLAVPRRRQVRARPRGRRSAVGRRRRNPSASFEPEPTVTYIVLPSGEKTMSRVQWPPAGRPAITVTASRRTSVSPLRIGEAQDRVGVGHIDELRRRARRIEGDAERLVEVERRRWCRGSAAPRRRGRANRWMRPAALSATSTSPLGARRIMRGVSRPAA